jgi:hypothetical protein
MSGLARRLDRLERSKPPRIKTYFEALEDFTVLSQWLADRGYADCLAAIEAGDSCPEGLEALLREQAGYDYVHRAFRRVEAALEAHKLPNAADVRLLNDRARLHG